MFRFRAYFFVFALLIVSSCASKGSHTKIQNKRHLCERLSSLPTGESYGIVLRVKTVDIPLALAPYNGSLVKSEGGYTLIYREDTLTAPIEKKKPMQYESNLYAICLSNEFEPLDKPVCLSLEASHAEDPRAFLSRNDFFVSYTDIATADPARSSIHLAKIDPKSFVVMQKNDLDLEISPIEKNWTPFTVDSEPKRLYMRYYINPSKVFSFNPESVSSDIKNLSMIEATHKELSWQDKWGKIRGGTPAVLTQGQYLSFFHSSFQEKGKMWYVMGAYTFESQPPFRITKISPFPILFDGMYQTEAKNTAKKGLRAVFPCGIVLDEEGGKLLAHVSLGENDCAVKIVTFDVNNLLLSLTNE